MSFVYVSNARDGTLSLYTLDPMNGELRPLGTMAVGNLVMPLALSADRRFLYAAIRSQPFVVATFRIDARTGALEQAGTASLAESMAYIATDRSGRYLFGASYGGDVLSVNAIGADGVVQNQIQVIKTGRHAHAIQADRSNRFVYATILGTDQVLQFDFDEGSGRLTPNEVPCTSLPARSGPRHFVFSNDGHFLYVLSELLGTVTSFAVGPTTGHLTEVARVEGVPATYGLATGVIRAPSGAGAPVDETPRIWASDIHLSRNGKFLYIAERTSNSISTFACDPATGAVTFVSNLRTAETQPRAFNIDPRGRFVLVAGEKSGQVSVYAIDPSRGSLSQVSQAPAGQGSAWVEIVDYS